MIQARLCVLTVFLVSCQAPNPAGPTGLTSIDALIAALREQGLSASSGGVLPQASTPYFSTSAHLVVANSATLNVFEYDSAAAADRDAARVSSDGSAIGTTQITWVGPPHFFKNGRHIVVYAGTSNDILQSLGSVLGAQFSPR